MVNAFMEWYVGVLKKYVVFTGRARRKEYWMFVLFNIIVIIAIVIVEIFADIQFGLLSWIYFAAVFLPNLAVSVRRLHDTNRSGWFIILYLIPLIGNIVSPIFLDIIKEAQLTQLITEKVYLTILLSWLSFLIILLIMSIIFLIFTVQEGTSGDNKYGPDPKA